MRVFADVDDAYNPDPADVEAMITPQRIRPGDEHCSRVAAWTLDTDSLGVSAWDFADTVAAEGIPVGGPYVGGGREGPLYRKPFLAEPAPLRLAAPRGRDRAVLQSAAGRSPYVPADRRRRLGPERRSAGWACLKNILGC